MTATITFENLADCTVIMTAIDNQAKPIMRCCLCGVRLDADDETNVCETCTQREN